MARKNMGGSNISIAPLLQSMNRMTEQLNSGFAKTNNLLELVNNQMLSINNSQQQVNKSLAEGEKKTLGFSGAVKSVYSAMKSVATAAAGAAAGVAGVIMQAETLQDTNVRMSLFNDGKQSNTDLQKKVFDVAQSTGRSYSFTSGLMGSIGFGANTAFNSNDHQLDFIKSFNQTLTLSGSDNAKSDTAVSQMAEAFNNGKLRGDGLTELLTNAPVMLDVLTKGLNKSQKELMIMADQGKLTSEQIVNAFTNQKDTIDDSFSEMPATLGASMFELQNIWGQWILGLNQADGPFQAIIQAVKTVITWLQSPAGAEFMSQLATGVTIATNLFLGLANVIGSVAGFLAENFSVVLSVLGALILGFTVFNAHMIATTLATSVLTLVTKGLAMAKMFLNNVIKANPMMFIISVVIALIGFFIMLWNTNDQFAAAMIRAWNVVLNFFDQAGIVIMKVVYGILNFFDSKKLEFVQIFEDIVNLGINIINGFINLLNKIPGVAIELIPQFVGDASKIAAENAKKQQDRANDISQMEASALADQQKREADVQKMLDDRAAERTKKDLEKKQGALSEKWEKAPDPKTYNVKDVGNQNKGGFKGTPALSQGGDLNNINKVGEVGSVKDSVDVSSEDLKLMRDMAEMKNIQNFVTLTPQVTLTTGDINSGESFDQILQKLKDTLTEEITGAAQGVYA